MSTTDFVTSLRAIATHIKRHDLDNKTLLSVEVREHADHVAVQVYKSAAFDAWRRTLANVAVHAELYRPETLIVDAFGSVRGVPVMVRTYITVDQEPAVHAAVLSLLKDPDSGEFEPIEPPAVLAGRDEAGDR